MSSSNLIFDEHGQIFYTKHSANTLGIIPLTLGIALTILIFVIYYDIGLIFGSWAIPIVTFIETEFIPFVSTIFILAGGLSAYGIKLLFYFEGWSLQYNYVEDNHILKTEKKLLFLKSINEYDPTNISGLNLRKIALDNFNQNFLYRIDLITINNDNNTQNDPIMLYEGVKEIEKLNVLKIRDLIVSNLAINILSNEIKLN